MDLETWELLSYVVTTVGLPLAIAVFVYEQHKERLQDESEVYQQLSDDYQGFLAIALEHPDLGLFSSEQTPSLTEEQRERMHIIFSMLVALFERAFILLYADGMARRQQRLWFSWEDYMREWCRRGDFRASLQDLLTGEDPDFVTYLNRVAAEEHRRAGPT